MSGSAAEPAPSAVLPAALVRADLAPGDRDRHREEADQLDESGRRGRLLDRELARDLDRQEPEGPAAPGSYLQELGERPHLPVSIERRLVALAKQGDSQARAQLVEAFLPLIAGVARIYRSTPSLGRLELMQEGVVGLLRALERYDTDRTTPFWASSAELAAATGIRDGQIQSLLAAERAPRGLDEPVAGDEDLVGRFGDLLVDPLAEDEYERVVASIEVDELRSLLSGLSDRERMVIRSRFGLDGPEESRGEIAERLGVSAERVRQLEQRALAKLRAAAVGETP